jgi:hypothetical protein
VAVTARQPSGRQTVRARAIASMVRISFAVSSAMASLAHRSRVGFGLVLNLVLVGDPDQTIFGFRSKVASRLPKFISTVRPGDRLDGNFRSSPAICSIVDSLRSSPETDVAVGRSKDQRAPIILVRFKSTSPPRCQSRYWIFRACSSVAPQRSLLSGHVNYSPLTGARHPLRSRAASGSLCDGSVSV